MMTLERASELVAKMTDFDSAIDLFCFFEEKLNPYSPELQEGRNWQNTFASLCGFGVVELV